MAHSIGWGILGTGTMASNFATALREMDDANIVAVASRSQESADRFAARFAIKEAYSNYHMLLNNPAVDVVYIATPHSLHHELCIASLHAGKSVLCEKAFTLNAGEAEEVIRLAREENLFLMEAMWTRCLPVVKKLRELLERRAIGEVQLMLAGGAYRPEFNPDFYLFNKALGGGILLDAGVYLVAMASLVFGVPNKILALGELGKTGVDEHEAILLSHENGAIANLFVSHRAELAPEMTLLGSRGKIQLHPPIFCPLALTLSVKGEVDQRFDFSEQSGYHFEIMEVHRCLRSGKRESNLMPLEETLSIMRTMDEIRRQLGVRYPAEL